MKEKSLEKNVELLSPAGNIESFYAACQNGADAIYMGIEKFNARAMAKNFDMETYIACIHYAHMRHVKVYLTLNTLLYDEEIKEALELVTKLYAKGLDAVIVQDIGFAMLLHKFLPDLALHASTQMSVHSLEQVQFLERIGFKRVVLARELTIEEIAYICKNTNVEIEVFVHGALCVSVSGQCLLSSTIGKRSANRGVCGQPCRMKYSLYNQKNQEIVKNTYILSKKDIFGLPHIGQLIKSGVTSLKLEGRNKSASYVAGITSTYRKYVDQFLKDTFKTDQIVDLQDEMVLMQLFNRGGKSSGYLKGIPYKNSITLTSPKNNGIYLGQVKDQKGAFVKLKLEQDINMHDGFEIYSNDEVISNIITCIRNDHYQIVNKEAKKGEYVWIGDVSKKVKFGSYIYKTSSEKLNQRFRKTYENGIQLKKQNINLSIKIKKESFVSVKVETKDKILEVSTKCMPQIAKTKELDEDTIKACFAKTKDTPFAFHITKLELDKGIFLSISELNQLRRNVIEALSQDYLIDMDISDQLAQIDMFLTSWKKECKEQYLKVKKEGNTFEKLSNFSNTLFVYSYQPSKDYIVLYEKKYQKTLKGIYINVGDYLKYREDILNKFSGKINIYIHIPNVVFGKLDRLIKENLEKILQDGIKGFLLGSLSYYTILQEYKKRYPIMLIADHTLNTANCYSALYYASLGFDVITPTYDILPEQMEEMSHEVQLEIIQDKITVMTSRYCILGSFVANRKENEICGMPCIKEKYYLKDTYGYRYDIVTDPIQCVMKLVRSIKNIKQEEYSFLSSTPKRNCIL